MATVYVGLGSNCGDGVALLRAALARVGDVAGVCVEVVSDFYRTPAVGGPPGQDDYANAAAQLSTSLSAGELLQAFHAVEASMGRRREVRWGPRTIDLDLLLYDDLIVETPQLQVPHPRMHYRRFVLRPLASIAGQTQHPAMQWSVSELLQHVEKRPRFLALSLPLPDRELLAARLECAVGRSYLRCQPPPERDVLPTRSPRQPAVEWMRHAELLAASVAEADDDWTFGDWAGCGWMLLSDTLSPTERELCRNTWRELQSSAKAPTLLVLRAETEHSVDLAALWRRRRLDGLQPRPAAPIVAVSDAKRAAQEILTAMQAAAAPCEPLQR